MTDRYISPHPKPSPFEEEVLVRIAEECSEVIQRAMKCCIFGLAEVQPGQALTNLQRLSEEIGDLEQTLSLASLHGLIDHNHEGIAQDRKYGKLRKYFQSLPEGGVL